MEKTELTTKEKLISMLQPKEYKSKIKLYCNKCEFNLDRSGEIVIFGEK